MTSLSATNPSWIMIAHHATVGCTAYDINKLNIFRFSSLHPLIIAKEHIRKKALSCVSS